MQKNRKFLQMDRRKTGQLDKLTNQQKYGGYFIESAHRDSKNHRK